MPRSQPGQIPGLIGKSGTFPVWFLRLDVAGVTHRFGSQGHDVTRSGFTWLGVGLRISDIDESDPNAKVFATLPNTDNFHTNLLHDHGIEHHAIIYRTWAADPSQDVYELDDFMQVFDGITAGAPSLGRVARYELVSTNVARLYPFLRIEPPTNNYCWKPDLNVGFNSKEIKVIE